MLSFYHHTTDPISSSRTILESQSNGPGPTATASPGGIRDDSVQEMAPKKPALNDLPSPPPGLDCLSISLVSMGGGGVNWCYIPLASFPDFIGNGLGMGLLM